MDFKKTMDKAIKACDDSRYEVVKIGEFLFGIYDKVKRKVVVESTSTGIKSYAHMFGAERLDNPRKI